MMWRGRNSFSRKNTSWKEQASRQANLQRGACNKNVQGRTWA